MVESQNPAEEVERSAGKKRGLKKECRVHKARLSRQK